MPTYEYRCKDCGHQLEVVQSFTEDPLTECPVCGGQLKKVFHPVGISFRGSGFYKTDARAGAAKSDGTTSESTDDKKSDKKPDSSKSAESGSSSKAEATSG